MTLKGFAIQLCFFHQNGLDLAVTIIRNQYTRVCMRKLNLDAAKDEVKLACSELVPECQVHATGEEERNLDVRWKSDGIYFNIDLKADELASWQQQGTVKSEIERKIKAVLANKKLPENNPNAPDASFFPLS